MIIFYYLLLIIAAFIMEYKEGMIMLQDSDSNDINPGNELGGIKEHKFYKKIYHYINTIGFGLVFLSGYLAGYFNLFQKVDNFFFVPFVVSLYFILNEFAELAYSKSRYGKWIPDYENFYFLELYSRLIISRHKVIKLHKYRIAFSVILLVLTFI